MLATLVIGLREGLEAALIVGIIAAFLRRTGKSLRGMWVGVSAAIALSIAVGLVLQVVSADLPQAQQEGMESIIGLIAVCFVTGMIGWMNQHARTMRTELEHSAAHALRDGTSWALVGMAFLAVLKEGFETSVFLLAAFQSSSSPLAAGIGAVLGVAIAVAIGVGIYRGGVKINLGRFFRITGIFLVLVAAGLFLSSVRTAHEAGWIQIGQQSTISLAWLAPNGSIQAALLTGVLGIPADPRAIEVLAWFAYLVPMMLYLLWPVSRRPSREHLPAVWLGLASAFTVLAVVLGVAVQLPGRYDAGVAPLVAATTSGSTIGAAKLTSGRSGRDLTTTVDGHTTRYAVTTTTPASQDGTAARLWQHRSSTVDTSRPTVLSLSELVALSGGRLPIGFNAVQNPGPFNAAWRTSLDTSARITGGVLLDASQRAITTVALSGGGLPTARVLSVDSPSAPSWSVARHYVTTTAAGIAGAVQERNELLLWKLFLPIALILAALGLAVATLRLRVGPRTTHFDGPGKPVAVREPERAPARV